MNNLISLVYKVSAMSYLPGVDSIRERAKAEANLIHAIKALQSERDSLLAERDRLLVKIGCE
jgi:hypothetical protein